MEKTKKYNNIIFSAEVLKKVVDTLISMVSEEKKARGSILTIKHGNEEWNYDTDEEFYADYRKKPCHAHLYKQFVDYSISISVERDSYGGYTFSSVLAPERNKIEQVFEVFESHVAESTLPPPPTSPKPKPNPPLVFIGHGHKKIWRELKDHLQEKHNYTVEAYEIGARAGHAIRDIIKKMLKDSSFAILVMTGEIDVKKGKKLARQNVIHEIGLFQGYLGFEKAIILLEEGTKEFSNIQGIQQIRFPKGKIKETFGDVLATLRREFGGINS